MAGRPKLDIDPAQVEQLALLGARNTDIADFFACDEAVIRRRFAAEITAGRAKRRMKIRKWQWDSAEAGNVTMQIWLGKNELGQTDKTSVEVSGTDGGPIQSEVTHSFDHAKFARIHAEVMAGRVSGDGVGPAQADRN